MSYIVLARKYRPMFFEEVAGQQHVTVTLQNAIEHKRIANAYLFSGPRGVGKTTVARLLAKALNCENGPTIKPCNQCSSCIEINESRSLDVFEIDGASNRGIDEVRNLREGLRYSASPGKYRIYIIDEVHMLTNEAFNALLKTLEEPPSKVLFIFATTESHKVPATILSRCQKFDFKRLPNKAIIDQLESICQRESITIEQEALRTIASKADGSMRDAQSILDQIIAFAGKSVESTDVADLLGLINRDLYFRMTDLILKKDVKGAVQMAQDIFVEGYDFNEFLFGLAEHFRHLLVALTTGTGKEMDVSDEDAEKYLALCQSFSVEDLLRYVKIVSDTENIIRRSSNARLHLEMALVKLVKMTASVQLSELLTHADELKKKSENGLKPDNQPHGPALGAQTLYEPRKATKLFQPPPPASKEENPVTISTSATTLSLQDIESRWNEIVEEVKKKKIALGSYLYDGWPLKLENGTLEIMFALNNGFQMSSVARYSDYLEKVFASILGASVRIRTIEDHQGELEKKRKTPVQTDKKDEFQKLVQQNKTVQSIVELFDAEFVK